MKKQFYTLAGVAQWIKYWPANQRVAGSIPSQGTCLRRGPGPQVRVHERQPHTEVSFPFSLPFPLSKNKFKKSLKKFLKIVLGCRHLCSTFKVSEIKIFWGLIFFLEVS